MEIRLGPAGRHVDPVFPAQPATLRGSRSRSGSVGFVEDAVEHVGLFFVATKAGAQRFIIGVPATFIETSIWTVAHRGRSELVCRFGRHQECVSSDAHS